MLALARWDGNYASTAFSLATEFSKTNRVFYIDNPFTFMDYVRHPKADFILKRKPAILTGKDPVKKLKDNLYAVCSPLMYPINWLPSGRLYNVFHRINNDRVSKTIEGVINDWSIEDFIYINSFNPFYHVHFPDNHQPALKIYHSVDNIEQSNYIHKHGIPLESKAVAQADFTVVTSSHLKRKKKQEGHPVYLVPNAADISLFNEVITTTFERPEDLPDDGRKVIGYTGNLDHRVDTGLLKKVAEAHPDKLLLLVGPVGQKLKPDFRPLEQLENVIFTGKKKYTELPQYLQFMDCCLIPFRVNELTACIYPLKINEYLAAGKPVVTTAFSEDLNDFGEVIHLSSDESDFLNNIDISIRTDSAKLQESRVEISKNNTWEDRVVRFKKIISNFSQKEQ